MKRKIALINMLQHTTIGLSLPPLLLAGLLLGGRSVAAAPFAYVTKGGSGDVSMIDTASNTVVGDPIVVGGFPSSIAITPDGKHAYVTNFNSSVSVIATATNTVVATIAVGFFPNGIAITPDGKHAYVTNGGSNDISVIDTTSNTVSTTITFPVGSVLVDVAIAPDGKHAYVTTGSGVSVIDTASNTVVDMIVAVDPGGHEIAITPDGKRAYMTNFNSSSVSVIDTASNTIVDTIVVGSGPADIAITPDGRHAYVVNRLFVNTVSVIDTVSNTVVGTIAVNDPVSVAITPDGKHAYVASFNSNSIAVIATTSNTVLDTIVVGIQPTSVAITPASSVPFSAFHAKLEIALGPETNDDAFEMKALFTLGADSNGINPLTDSVTLQIGTFSTILPAGSFTKVTKRRFKFEGVINGVAFEAVIQSLGHGRFLFKTEGQGAELTGTVNPVPVTLTIGNDTGSTSVMAEFE